MPQEGKRMPPPDTLAGLLLTLTALSGEFPTALISRLPGGDAYKKKVVKRLKKDRLLHTYYADGLRGLRLTVSAKKLLLASWPNRFCPYLTGRSETNMLKSEAGRRLRLHRMAEVLVTMHNAGVAVFPWQKPVVFMPPNDVWIERPVYYSSREVKEIGPQCDKIRGSRATGVLLTEDNVFAVYNIGASEMKWEGNAEARLQALLRIDLCQHRVPSQYGDIGSSGAIVFGADMGRMPVLMGVGDDKRRKYFTLDECCQQFHYLTSDHHGEVVSRLLCDRAEKARLDDILAEGLSKFQSDWLMPNDAMDGDCPVLFAYTCDMPRIKRFASGVTVHGLKGLLYCFDFQEEALSKICGPNVELQCIDFDAVKDGF